MYSAIGIFHDNLGRSFTKWGPYEIIYMPVFYFHIPDISMIFYHDHPICHTSNTLTKLALRSFLFRWTEFGAMAIHIGETRSYLGRFSTFPTLTTSRLSNSEPNYHTFWPFSVKSKSLFNTQILGTKFGLITVLGWQS